jgi:hypothetical protein
MDAMHFIYVYCQQVPTSDVGGAAMERVVVVAMGIRRVYRFRTTRAEWGRDSLPQRENQEYVAHGIHLVQDEGTNRRSKEEEER